MKDSWRSAEECSGLLADREQVVSGDRAVERVQDALVFAALLEESHDLLGFLCGGIVAILLLLLVPLPPGNAVGRTHLRLGLEPFAGALQELRHTPQDPRDECEDQGTDSTGNRPLDDGHSHLRVLKSISSIPRMHLLSMTAVHYGKIRPMNKALLLLRVGVAFSFVYAAISGYLNPTAWIGFFPSFAQSIASPPIIVGAWGIVETLVALVLLFKKDVFVVGSVAALLLFGITVFNWGAMDIVFRDISIGFAALALAFLSRDAGTVSRTIITNSH